jgi:hypothetical protein
MAFNVLNPIPAFLAIFLVLSGPVCMAQQKSVPRKNSKTHSAGQFSPGKAPQTKKLPAKTAEKKTSDPFSHFNQILGASIDGRSPKLEPVAPKPNVSDSLLMSVLEKAQAGHQRELLRPVIFLIPPDSAGKLNFIRFCKVLKAEEKGPKSIMVKTFDGIEDLALVINGYDNLTASIKYYPRGILETYVFTGIEEIENSKDPYIRFLNVSKSLFKMVAMQNVDFLPTIEELQPAGVQIEVR